MFRGAGVKVGSQAGEYGLPLVLYAQIDPLIEELPVVLKTTIL
jgi:hypothetical protein